MDIQAWWDTMGFRTENWFSFFLISFFLSLYVHAINLDTLN